MMVAASDPAARTRLKPVAKAADAMNLRMAAPLWMTLLFCAAYITGASASAPADVSMANRPHQALPDHGAGAIA